MNEIFGHISNHIDSLRVKINVHELSSFGVSINKLSFYFENGPKKKRRKHTSTHTQIGSTRTKTKRRRVVSEIA